MAIAAFLYPLIIDAINFQAHVMKKDSDGIKKMWQLDGLLKDMGGTEKTRSMTQKKFTFFVLHLCIVPCHIYS